MMAIEALFSFEPFFKAATRAARSKIIKRAESIGIDWSGAMRDMEVVDWPGRMRVGMKAEKQELTLPSRCGIGFGLPFGASCQSSFPQLNSQPFCFPCCCEGYRDPCNHLPQLLHSALPCLRSGECMYTGTALGPGGNILLAQAACRWASQLVSQSLSQRTCLAGLCVPEPASAHTQGNLCWEAALEVSLAAKSVHALVMDPEGKILDAE